MVGQKINALTVVEEYKVQTDFEDVPYFKCKCSCGNIVSTKMLYVMNNIFKSCGDQNPDRK